MCGLELVAWSAAEGDEPRVALGRLGTLEALADKLLILHAADYDLRMMRATFGFRPRGGIFDTMLAAQLLGHPQLGLAAAVEGRFGVTLCKKGKKSNWSRRPLTPYQLQYASDDTRYLGALADHLGGELERLGRTDWHRESCEALIEATAENAARDPDRAWRIKGASRLDRRELAFVRELWQWRESEAQKADLPPFRVLGNHQLLELALWAASHPRRAPDRGPKLPRNCT
ncbi:HRDC domain-containing protein, partial [Planctomycetota bacterium]